MIYLERISKPESNQKLLALLAGHDLTLPEGADDNLGLYDDRDPGTGSELLGCGFLAGNMIQGLAVRGERQGEGLSATLVSGLIKLAADRGIHYLRVITKPAMAPLLAGLGMRLVADASPYAVFLEFGSGSVEDSMGRFRALAAENAPAGDSVAALVMNCNPFTLGHRALIEQTARENPHVYVLVVEEDRSVFPFADRLRLVERGTADLPNVRVIPGGEYVISSLTFPAYFTRDADLALAQGSLDAAVFAAWIGPALGVSRRYVGTEPLSPSTALYNRALKERLPPAGIEVVEVERFTLNGEPVSASRVRAALDKGDWDTVRALVPDCTWEYLRKF